MPLREGLAIVMVFSVMMPAVYCLAPDRDEGLILRLFLANLCILPFVLCIRFLVFRTQSYGAYLLASLACLGAGVAAAYLVSLFCFSGITRPAFLVVITVQLLMVASDAAAIRMNLIRRRRAREANEIGWVSQSTLLEEPRSGFFLFFVLSYLWGLSLDCRMLCDISLGLAILYLPLTLSYGYQRGLGQYLNDMSSIAGIPTRRIHLVGKAIMSVLLAVLLLLSLSSIALRGLRPYTDIRNLRFEYHPAPPEESEIWIDVAGTDMAIFEELMDKGEYRPAPLWAEVLFSLIGAACVLWLVSLGWKAIRHRFEEFRQTYDEGDLIISLADEAVKPLPLIRKIGRPHPTGERWRIRQRYKRIIEKALPDPPRPQEMPIDLETRAGLAGTREGQELHETYESARYDRE